MSPFTSREPGVVGAAVEDAGMGRIAPGFRADRVLFIDDFEVLETRVAGSITSIAVRL